MSALQATVRECVELLGQGSPRQSMKQVWEALLRHEDELPDSLGWVVGDLHGAQSLTQQHGLEYARNRAREALIEWQNAA